MAAPPPAGTWEQTVLEAWRDGAAISAVGGEVEVHLEHARALAALLDSPARFLDLGTGAGIPGLALAGLWPAARGTLVDAAQRRLVPVRRAVVEVGWGDRIDVIHGRAEELAHDPAHRGQYDLVVARAFGPPAVVAECGAGFLAVGGCLAVTEPPDATGDRWRGIADAGLGLQVGELRRSASLTVQLLRAVEACPDRFPRRPGVPAKRPLFA